MSCLARLVASSTARSIVASPTTIRAASLLSSISPTSLMSERDMPPSRWPIRAPAPAPSRPPTRMEGGKIRPIAAPTASPATMLGRFLYLVDDLDLAFFVLGDHGRVVGANDVLAVHLLQRLEVGLGVIDTLVLARVKEHRVVAHRALLSPSPSVHLAPPCDSLVLHESYPGFPPLPGCPASTSIVV